MEILRDFLFFFRFLCYTIFRLQIMSKEMAIMPELSRFGGIIIKLLYNDTV